MSGPPAPAWVLTAALAMAGAVGYLATRATGTPPAASLVPDPGPASGLCAAMNVAPSIATPPPVQQGALVAEESARMFAAEPALADLIEDASSDDVAVREQAQLALEQIDLDRLRETVTPLQR